jgi:Ca2+-binding RTX toxin-like protein
LFDNILQDVVVQRPLSAIDSVEIVGADGEDDSLTIDYFFGGFFDLPGSIFFDGGAGIGTDTFRVQADVDFTLINGSLAISAGGSHDFFGVEVVSLTRGTGNNTLDASAFTSGDVILIGSDADDILIGGSGNDLLVGGEGNNTLFSGDGNDTLSGGAGNDTLIDNGDGDKWFDGGVGDDTYELDPGSIIVVSDDDGDDMIDLSSSTDDSTVTATSTGGTVTEVDGDGEVEINGTIESYTLTDGDDTFIDETDQELLTIDNGLGDDTYLLDPGSIIVVSDDDGDDMIDLSSSTDDATVTATSTGGTVTDVDGEIIIDGTIESYTLTDGDDTFIDETDQELLTIDGGLGDDTYLLDPGSIIVMSDDDGDDMIDLSLSTDDSTVTATTMGGTVTDVDGEVIIDGTIETYTLTDGDDTFIDETDQELLTINGGDGDDTYELDPGSTIIVNDTVGTNTLNFGDSAEGINVSLEDGIAFDSDGEVFFVGSIIEVIIGSTGDDVIVGTSGDEVFDGNGGNDLLNGDGGNDLYIIRAGGEITLFDSDGVDTLDFSNLTLGINVNLTRSGGQIQRIDESGNDLVLNGMFENVIGTPFDDKIGGNSADNLLDGGAGNDQIGGSSGNDILLGRAGDDDLVGGPGRDFLVGGFGSDRLVGSSEEDIVIGGALNFGDQEATAIDAIFAEWTSERKYAERVANITGTGVGDRLNGEFFLNSETIIDDEDEDQLTGSSQSDVFFIGMNDIITDFHKKESNRSHPGNAAIIVI